MEAVTAFYLLFKKYSSPDLLDRIFLQIIISRDVIICIKYQYVNLIMNNITVNIHGHYERKLQYDYVIGITLAFRCMSRSRKISQYETVLIYLCRLEKKRGKARHIQDVQTILVFSNRSSEGEI